MQVVRTLRLLVLLLAIVPVALSQTVTGADQVAAPQNPNQPLQSPLQDQPTGIAAEQQTQQEAQRSGQLSKFETPAPASQDQALGEIRLMTRYTEIGGDQTRSFRDEGVNNLAEFNYFADRRFFVTRRVQTLAMFRATDDFSIDPEHNSVQKGFVRIYGPRDEYIFGDALVNYSRLTFNQNIKGASGSWKLGDNWKLGVVGGVFVDRWGSFYKDLPGRPYEAAVTGAHLQYSFDRTSFIGFNLASSNDLVDSLPVAAVGLAPDPANNVVGSVELKVQKKNFQLNSEYAYSTTDFDTRDNSGLCPTFDTLGNSTLSPCDSRQPQPYLGYQNDWGGRAEALYRYGRLSLRGSYVRFQPNFASINARQLADLQDAIGRVSVDATDWLTVDGTARRSNNDLRDQLTFETIQWQPEGRFIFHDLAFSRRVTFEVGYRHRIVSASNGSIDRFVRMPYAEVNIPLHGTFLNFGYERRQTIDQIDQSQSNNTNRYYFGIRGVYDLAGWHVNPALRYELERGAQRPDLSLIPAIFRLDYDTNRLGSVLVTVEAPRWFIAEVAYRDTSATIYGPAGYHRPSYRAQLTYKFRNNENLLLIASFERNNNFFIVSPDYDERTSGLTIVYKFGKRGR